MIPTMAVLRRSRGSWLAGLERGWGQDHAAAMVVKTRTPPEKGRLNVAGLGETADKGKGGYNTKYKGTKLSRTQPPKPPPNTPQKGKRKSTHPKNKDGAQKKGKKPPRQEPPPKPGEPPPNPIKKKKKKTKKKNPKTKTTKKPK